LKKVANRRKPIFFAIKKEFKSRLSEGCEGRDEENGKKKTLASNYELML
jgi:hypothetical protein